MDKNTLTGIVLIFLLVFVYMHFLAPPPPREVQEDIPSAPPAQVEQEVRDTDPSVLDDHTVEVVAQARRHEHTYAVLSNQYVSYTFSDFGGALYAIELAQSDLIKYPVRTLYAPSNAWEMPLRIKTCGDRPSMTYIMGLAEYSIDTVTYTGVFAGVDFMATYRLSTNAYLLDVNLTFTNNTEEEWSCGESFDMWLGQMEQVSFTRDRHTRRGADVHVIRPDGSRTLVRENAGRSDEWKEIPGLSEWSAVRNKYFTHILIPESPASSVHVRSIGPRDARNITAYTTFPLLALEPGESYEWIGILYTGPKSIDMLKALPTIVGRGTAYDRILDLGWFSFLARPILVYGLKGLYRYTHNYGIAIIILTVLIKIVTWPLTTKSVMSMKQMQKMQPEVQALKEKYKDDPRKMQQETMLLYKKHGANPLGGCLPMLLQIPIFISLYAALSGAIELWGAGFWWINDLSLPDTVYYLQFQIPFLGSDGVTGVNPLPLLMCGATIGQQALSPSAGDPNQKMMMYFMPVIFVFIFYNMPSGLTLYWFVNQVLTMGQMFYLHYIKK